MKKTNQNHLKIFLFLCVLCFTGAISANAQTLGDVNSNGDIDIVDALLIAQYYVGLNPSGFSSSAADVDCSGDIDIVDALLVAQYYVGLLSQFPCSTTPAPTAPPDRLPPGFSRGLNMGNYLEAPNEGEWTGGRTIQDQDFTIIKNAGFDFVRVPVRWSNHARTSSPYTLDETFRERVVHVVDTALAAGLYVVMNIHHYSDEAYGGNIMTNPVGQHDRFIELWRQIANRFQNHSDKLMFEVLNEPTNEAIVNYWNQYCSEAIQVMRQTNPTRWILAGPVHWNSIHYLADFTLPDTSEDPYIILTVHYYEPHDFTHQGAEWANPVPPCGVVWGTQAEQNDTRDTFTQAYNWASARNLGVLLGEFGVYGGCAAMSERVEWTAFVREQAEQNGFAWSYWEYDQGFGVRDSDANQWRTELLQALIP